MTSQLTTKLIVLQMGCRSVKLVLCSVNIINSDPHKLSFKVTKNPRLLARSSPRSSSRLERKIMNIVGYFYLFSLTGVVICLTSCL